VEVAKAKTGPVVSGSEAMVGDVDDTDSLKMKVLPGRIIESAFRLIAFGIIRPFEAVQK
jgi:hypothetical protein